MGSDYSNLDSSTEEEYETKKTQNLTSCNSCSNDSGCGLGCAVIVIIAVILFLVWLF